MHGVIDALSGKYPSVHFYTVETEAVPEVSQDMNVTVVPTFFATFGKSLLGKVEGANPAELSKLVKKLVEAASPPQTVSSVVSVSPPTPPAATQESKEAALHTKLKGLINQAPVMLFMKGTPAEPKCGFSRQIVEILKSNDITFASFNILSDLEVREGLKVLSDWPTYPQLYVHSELIGGLDIVKEMVAIASSGASGAPSLKEQFGIASMPAPTPEVVPKPAAAEVHTQQVQRQCSPGGCATCTSNCGLKESSPAAAAPTSTSTPATAAAAPAFVYQELFDLSPDTTTVYKKLTDKYVTTVELNGTKFLQVEPEALRLLAAQAMADIAHLLRPAHLQQLSNIMKDPEATENDRFVALELLKNANIAANFVLPGCQDTGTAIVSGKRGQHVLTDGNDEEHLSRGIYDTYTQTNLRYSQVAPLTMFKEVNTNTNLPAQIELYATKGSAYHFLFIAKGGGSANKTYLYQQTKALLNPASLVKFFEENIKTM